MVINLSSIYVRPNSYRPFPTEQRARSQFGVLCCAHPKAYGYPPANQHLDSTHLDQVSVRYGQGSGELRLRQDGGDDVVWRINWHVGIHLVYFRHPLPLCSHVRGRGCDVIRFNLRTFNKENKM